MSAKVRKPREKKPATEKQISAAANARAGNKAARQGIDLKDGSSKILLTHKGGKTPGTFSSVAALKRAQYNGYEDARGKMHDPDHTYHVQKVVHIIPKSEKQKAAAAKSSEKLEKAWDKVGRGKGKKLTKAAFQ